MKTGVAMYLRMKKRCTACKNKNLGCLLTGSLKTYQKIIYYILDAHYDIFLSLILATHDTRRETPLGPELVVKKMQGNL
jgi:hypothetical protein